MILRSLIALSLALVLGTTHVAAIAAPRQQPKNNKPKKPDNKPKQEPKGQATTIVGEIGSVGAGRMTVKSSFDKQRWTVGGTEKTKVRISGTMEGSYLRPGMWVEFVADVDKDDTVVNQPTEIALIQPPPVNKQGVLPAVAKAGQLKEKPAAPAGKKGRRPKYNAEKIVGRITACDGKTVSIQAAARTVRLPLEDSATIGFSSNDPKQLKSGAKVTVKGKAMGGNLLADSIEAAVSQPLKGPPRSPADATAAKAAPKPLTAKEKEADALLKGFEGFGEKPATPGGEEEK